MRTLFRGGYVVSVDKTIGNVKNCDVLVDGDRIVSVGQDLPVEGAEVIDATNCIILPGFVDVHRHTWQTQLRSAAKNWTLYDYLVTMRMCYPAFYTEDDAYLGNYMGGLDSLNSGITTNSRSLPSLQFPRVRRPLNRWSGQLRYSRHLVLWMVLQPKVHARILTRTDTRLEIRGRKTYSQRAPFQ